MNDFKIVKRSGIILVLLIVLSGVINAQDWPQWRGPEQDAICTETGLLQSWPEGGPEFYLK